MARDAESIFEDVCNRLGGSLEGSGFGEKTCEVSDEDSFIALAALVQSVDAPDLNVKYRYEDAYERVEVDFGKEGKKFEMRGRKVGFSPLVDADFHNWLVDEAQDEWGLSEDQAERFASSAAVEDLPEKGYDALRASTKKRPENAKPYVWDKVACDVEHSEATWATFPACETSVEQDRMVLSSVFGDLMYALDAAVDGATEAFYNEVRSRGEKLAKKFKK